MSLPTRECGLKSCRTNSFNYMVYVTPYAGVWIEICIIFFYKFSNRSLPTRECGLKFFHLPKESYLYPVTPYAGVWIEIVSSVVVSSAETVTPYAGVWIEIGVVREYNYTEYSHSLRGSVD